MALCDVSPISAFMSTNLNNKIECFGQVADRIKRNLGWPLVSLQIHQDGLYENIQQAVELYTKFAGYTQEYLIFDSDLYERNRGIRLDTLFSVYGQALTQKQKVDGKSRSQDVGAYISTSPTAYVALSTIPYTIFSTSSSLSALFTDDISCYVILDCPTHNEVLAFDSSLSAYFQPTRQKGISMQCDTLQGSVSSSGDCGEGCGTTYNNMFDYDAMDYRKVISVVNFEEGSNEGINTLFTLEQTLAQQTYFSYAMGNFGFDLVSWYTMKEWIDCREKMLAIRRTWKFDERTQYLTFYPQPDQSRFYGVMTCYVERPIRDVIKEPWVQQYALALTKITIGRVRGQFQGVTLLGGGSFNYDLLEEGRQEKEQLEKELKEGASPGWDSDPCVFLVA